MENLVKKFSDSQTSLVIQQSDFSLESLSNMIEKNIINLAPHYQRRERWDDDKQSKLIESFILNVPVPPIYFSEDEYGVYSVIDGKQRLTAIHEFLIGNLKLTGLNTIKDLNGLTFEKLPLPIRNALGIRPYIRIVTLLKQSEPSLKYEVFLRLNTGGEKLEPQEIRNVAYDGKLNKLLYELSENGILKQKLKIENVKSSAFRKMVDLENILRFFTMYEYGENSSSRDTSKLMDLYMENNRNPNEKALEDLKNLFEKSIYICDKLWQGKAFFRPTSNDTFREQFIAPLYDAQMVAVAKLINENREDEFSNINRDILLEKTAELSLNNQAFIKATTQGTNNSTSIKIRIDSIYNMLQELM